MIGEAWKTHPDRPANTDPVNHTNWRPRYGADGWISEQRNRYSPLRLWYKIVRRR